MSKYADVENICFALAVFLGEVKNQCAALIALDNLIGEESSKNAFLNTIQEALWCEMLSEIAKLFDQSA